MLHALGIQARKAWSARVIVGGRSSRTRWARHARTRNEWIKSLFIPVGVILALLGVPVIGGLLALRMERRLTKVERASQTLAAGELSARVDITRGLPDELAMSFNEMAERVESLVRDRDELVQAVSHELGSPLSRLHKGSRQWHTGKTRTFPLPYEIVYPIKNT